MSSRARLVTAVALSLLSVLGALCSGAPTSMESGPLTTSAEVGSTGNLMIARAQASLEHGGGPAHLDSLDCGAAVSSSILCSGTSADALSPSTQSPRWTNLSGPIAPPRNAFVSMTYDFADQYVVLFGGLDASAFATNYTWTFANGTWTNITSTAGPAPSARYDMAMTYDATDGYVLAFGGSSTGNCACNDTWSFVHGKWNRTDAVPPYEYSGGGVEVERFSMTYDPADGYVLATDGTDTWRYSSGIWSSFCGTNCTNFIPAPGLQGTVAYDASDGYVIFLGSAFNVDSLPSVAQGSYTWKFSGGTWTNLTATAGTAPPAREYASLVSDSATGGLSLFGGLSSTATGGFDYLNDTWMFVNGTWSRLSSAPSPQGVFGAGIADDAVGSFVVLFGGESGNGNAWNLNYTWVWGSSPPIGELSLTIDPHIPDPGTNASFNVTFAGGVAPFSYYWSFGDGGSSPAQNPVHVFAADGYFVVQVWVNDSAGQSAKASLRIHAYTPLSVSALLASPDPAILGEAVNFTASATGGTPPYTFSWAFGDGGLGGNLSSITHVYTTNGPFEAQITVSDVDGGLSRGFVNVTIKLEALAGSSDTSGASPLTVSFVGQAQGGVPPYRFEWSFGDGSKSSIQDPQHTYNSSGHYIAALTVTDSRNNMSSSSLSIDVGGGPSVSGPSSSDWFYASLAAAAGIASMAAVWSAVTVRRRGQQREGEHWVEELTSGEEPETGRMPPRPR
jgi:PKD repeat protein